MILPTKAGGWVHVAIECKYAEKLQKSVNCEMIHKKADSIVTHSKDIRIKIDNELVYLDTLPVYLVFLSNAINNPGARILAGWEHPVIKNVLFSTGSSYRSMIAPSFVNIVPLLARYGRMLYCLLFRFSSLLLGLIKGRRTRRINERDEEIMLDQFSVQLIGFE
jgi:hypothetical protein